MKGISNCELCGNSFEWERYSNQSIARFCGKACWYKWNSENLASFNEKRFQWSKASKQEKLERLRSIFDDKVTKTDSCWFWTGTKDPDGYGMIHYGKNKQLKAHRASWLIHRGDFDLTLIVCHSCDNPSCVNPDHLFLGTVQTNTLDKVKKNRQTKGSTNFGSKLTEESVLKIKELLSLGVTGSRIAKDYKISTSVISSIKQNKSWKHV